MSKCKFTLTVKGNNIEFDTEEQLNSYLKTNYDTLSRGHIGGDVELSTVLEGKEKTKLEQTVAKLQTIASKTPEITTVEFNENGERVIKSAYEGVTKRIKRLAKAGGLPVTYYDEKNYIDNRLIQIRSALRRGVGPETLKADYANIISKFTTGVEQLKGAESETYDKLTKALIMPLIIKEQAQRKLLGTFGTNLHRMAETYFANRLENSDKSFSIGNFPAGITNLSTEGKENYLQYLKELTNFLKSEHGDDVVLLPEYKIFDDATKLVGIIDLLAIDSMGKVHIYDFKASYKDPSDWHSAKQIEFKYQLGIYSNMLKNKGFDVRGIQVLPITMLDINFDDETIPRLAEHLPFDASPSEDIKYNINNSVIPLTTAAFFESTSNSHAIITENLKKAWGYNLKLKSSYANVQAFKDSSRVTTDINKPGVFTFWDNIKRKFIDNTAESLDKNIENYLKSEAEATSSELLRFKDWMIASIAGKKQLIDFKRRSEIGNIHMVRAFEKYTKGGWTLVADDADLDSLGLLMFVNESNKSVEFVSYTVNALNKKVKLPIGSTIVGNFISDGKGLELPDLLPATNGNIELLKTYFYINENAEKLKDFTVGRVMAYNPINSEFVVYNNDVLKTNFGYLISRLEGKNTTLEVNTTDKLLALHNQFVEIITEPSTSQSEKDLVNKYLTTLNDYQNTGRMESLKIIQKDLHMLLNKYGQHKVNSFMLFEEKLYGMISEAIVAEADLRISTSEKDIPKYSANGTMLSNPGSIGSRNLRVFVDVIKLSMHKIRRRQTEFKATNVEIFDKYLTSKGKTNLRRATVGDNIRAYDSLFEGNSPNKELILKNPYDKNTPLNNEEREFLKYFLKEINFRRFNTQSLDSETAQDMISSKEWFKLPLLRASSSSKASNMSLKGLRDATTENWNSFLNTNHLFDEKDEQAVKNRSEDMFTMFNEFNFHAHPDARMKLIEQQSPNAFETNLERVLDNFVFSAIRKEEYDDMLPIANAVRTTIAYNGFGVNIPVPNALEFMDKYSQAAVFNEKSIPPELRGVYKGISIIKDITSKMNLGINPLSGFVNTLQGLWGNVSRITAGKYPNMFGKEDYFWALNHFCKDSSESMTKLTVLENLNMIYGINNMDINILSEVMSKNNSGLLNFKSKYLYWMAYAPDYFNRMTLFIAQMHKDGCFEAHKMVGNQMVYDWTLDKRFSEYAKGNTSHPDYNNQFSLYMAVLADFNKEGYALTKGQALPYAYTGAQRESMKMFSDSIHGYYDHESKTLANNTILGVLFFQFKTWITAKKDQWALHPDTYAIGDYGPLVLDGVKQFIDKDGNQTTEDTGMPMMKMQGSFQEGILYSLKGMAQDFQEAKWDIGKLWEMTKEHPERMSNMKLMLFDLGVVIAMAITTGLIDWDQLKKDDTYAYTMYRAIIRSSSDLNVLNNVTTVLDMKKSPFMSFNYMGDLIYGMGPVLTGDQDFSKYLFTNTGLLRPFTPLLATK